MRHLLSEGMELVRLLQVVDALQQLGVAYHFEKEINDVLITIYKSKENTIMEMKDDLYATSLLFRLLREHGFHISPGTCTYYAFIYFSLICITVINN